MERRKESKPMLQVNDRRRGPETSGYRPEHTLDVGPLFVWPPRPLALFKWLFGFPGYFWPWQTLFVGIALLSWWLFTPEPAQLRDGSIGWVAWLLVRNAALLSVFVGLWHARLYIQRAQGTRYKYDTRWLATNEPNFLFRNQLWDNVFWNLCSAVPIWTAYEAVTLWLQANGISPTLNWQARPLTGALLLLVTPIWLSIHFYAVHRLIHWQPLYRAVHSLHHKNVNFGPWSGLAMHPVEHLLYFSAVVPCWFVPTHPVHVLYVLQSLALATTVAHTGFDRLMLGANKSLNIGDYWHYLHHKYFNVNYGVELIPIDKWLGTLHDGSDEATEAMKARLRARLRRSRGRHPA